MEQVITNPYEVLATADEAHPATKQFDLRSKLLWMVWSCCFFYPLIAIGSVYLAWLTAWVMLGHQPREMLNDPKQIGGPMDAVYTLSILLVTPWPALTAGGFFVTLLCPIHAIRHRFVPLAVLAFAYILQCIIAFGFIILDPGRIFSWWLD